MINPDDITAALRGLQENPHNHGWHPFYAVLEHLLEAEKPSGGPLTRITGKCCVERPHITGPHLSTLLSISLKSILGDWRQAPVFDTNTDIEKRAQMLGSTIEEHEVQILDKVLTRQNSFSSARRFLIPQKLIAHFAGRTQIPVRLADLGTGAGLLPRQLNSLSNYRRFAPDLKWHDWNAPFVKVPYELRWGVDRTPAGDHNWIRDSYGPSLYYDERYAELAWAFHQPDVSEVDLPLANIDLLKSDELKNFLREQAFNVITCSFVLYQYDIPTRETIVADVVSALPQPGLFISLEPTGDLSTPGASIRAYLPGNPKPLDIGRVSDAHCIGEVTPGRDLRTFRRE